MALNCAIFWACLLLLNNFWGEKLKVPPGRSIRVSIGSCGQTRSSNGRLWDVWPCTDHHISSLCRRARPAASTFSTRRAISSDVPYFPRASKSLRRIWQAGSWIRISSRRSYAVLPWIIKGVLHHSSEAITGGLSHSFAAQPYSRISSAVPPFHWDITVKYNIPTTGW